MRKLAQKLHEGKARLTHITLYQVAHHGWPKIPKTIPMKTTSIISKAAGLSLLCSVFLASNAVAGPGPQFWAAQGKPKTDSAVSTTKAEATPVTLCSGAEVVASTIMKPMMANGKGPLVPVQVGTKTVCHICPVTTVITRNSLPNGKGTPFTTEVTKIGAEHNCAKCTGNPAKS